MSFDLETVLKAYEAAWCERNAARRLEHLEQAWAEDGAYSGPTGEAEGREALNDHIGGHFANRPDHVVTIEGEPRKTTDGVEFDWIMDDGAGGIAMTGTDHAALGPDGLIHKLERAFNGRR